MVKIILLKHSVLLLITASEFWNLFDMSYVKPIEKPDETQSSLEVD